MSDEEQQEKINQDALAFLTSPELIEQFQSMYQKRLEYIRKQKDELDKKRDEMEKTLAVLEDNLEILDNYSKFINQKGFGYCKQEADSYFEEMVNAEKARMSEPNFETLYNCSFTSEPMDDDPICGQYFMGGDGITMRNCPKPKGHKGKCGL